MFACVLLPDIALRCALRAAQRPDDAVAALGPMPGEPTVIATPTPTARACGVVEGLRVGEALSRCPTLEIIPPDPVAVTHTHERLLTLLEDLGAAVEPAADGVVFFDPSGLERMYGGLRGVLTRVRMALPIGLDGRIGVAPTRFAAQHAARLATTRTPRIVLDHELEAFLAPLAITPPICDPHTSAGLHEVGIRTLGDLAALSHRHALHRLGFRGITVWHNARGHDERPLHPRPQPRIIQTHMGFLDPLGSTQALHTAIRIVLNDLATTARARGTSLRTLTLRALYEGDGSWSRTVTLREATCDPARLLLACAGSFAEITSPVTALIASGDASGSPAHGQLSVLSIGADERARRVHDAAEQIRARMGDQALVRAVEMDPHSRIPERRWALAPFDTSPHHSPSA